MYNYRAINLLRARGCFTEEVPCIHTTVIHYTHNVIECSGRL